tara:strand:+ start:4158 stop:4286 length:129 start_codon:yes stop_codon:yes gene_type:complete
MKCVGKRKLTVKREAKLAITRALPIFMIISDSKAVSLINKNY